MRNLISFLIKNVHWFLFVLLIFVSVFLIVNNNDFQRSKFLSVELEVTGRVYALSNEIKSYVGLKKVNADLNERVAELERKNTNLLLYIKEKIDTTRYQLPEFEPSDAKYDFVCAQVINKTLFETVNLITLDKGQKAGILPGMGVFSATGVVGHIMASSDYFSIVIPIISDKSSLSCKIARSGFSGTLNWDGKDSQYAFLEELPRHVDYHMGDTVVTTVYSSIFPENIMVGVVVDSKKQKEDDNFYSLRVKLLTDFSTLKEVLVVKSKYGGEQKQLEEKAKQQLIRGGTINGF